MSDKEPGFSVVDGSAYYWHLKKWRFDSLPVLARVHAFLISWLTASRMIPGITREDERIPILPHGALKSVPDA